MSLLNQIASGTLDFWFFWPLFNPITVLSQFLFSGYGKHLRIISKMTFMVYKTIYLPVISLVLTESKVSGSTLTKLLPCPLSSHFSGWAGVICLRNRLQLYITEDWCWEHPHQRFFFFFCQRGGSVGRRENDPLILRERHLNLLQIALE